MKKKIFAICGSTRKTSSNLNLIKAIEVLSEDLFDIDIFNGLTELPHFNPDDDHENPSAKVKAFRERIKIADGVLICTPEYAMGVPGSLKNAIDWTVSSMEFSKKPTALITASSLGQKSHASLLETLRIIECNVTVETQLVISHVKTKISPEAKIVDEKTSVEINGLIKAFAGLIS